MQIGSNTSYNIGSSYSIKLNQKEMLVVEEDPLSRSQFESRKAQKEKEQELEKSTAIEKASNPRDPSSQDMAEQQVQEMLKGESVYKNEASNSKEVRPTLDIPA